jgi:hypothetical protein
MFRNWTGRSQEEIEQARRDWTEGGEIRRGEGVRRRPSAGPRASGAAAEAAGKGSLTCGASLDAVLGFAPGRPGPRSSRIFFCG